MRSLRLIPILLFIAACAPAAPRPKYVDEARGPDHDGDGIADIDDRCPDEAEDGYPPLANDGCPADDPDNDGIGRAKDKCPLAKEDGLGPDPTDGCPSNDADGDGVADAFDKCPDKREDNLPPAPNDGCPAPDRDGDGIVDALDKCPDQPETFNGWEDADGCPDTVPVSTQVIVDQKEMVVHLPPGLMFEFPPGSTELTPAGKRAAAEAAKVIAAHPEWERIEIEGHASSKGDDKANIALTLERSRAVGRALVANGILPRRLVAIGYGECCPKIDKGDNVDEPANRRVELKIVRINGQWQNVPRGCWKATQSGIDPAKAEPGIPPAAPGSIDTYGGGV